MTELDLVIDEELAAEHEEQYDAGDDLTGVLVQVELAGDLNRALLHEHQQEGDRHHGEGIQLGKPRDHDGREAAPARQTGGDGVARATDEHEARQAAETAGDRHGAYDDVFDVDARVARGVHAGAHVGNFIAVLGIAQVDVDERRDRHDQHQVPAVGEAEQLGQPAGLVLRIDQAHAVGARGVFPEDDAEGHDLRGDVVHHQRKQRFVGVPARLEQRRDDAPDHARHDGGQRHHEQQQPAGQRAAQVDHHRRRGRRADEHLSLAADVPEAHLEGRGDRHRHQQKRQRVADRHPQAAVAAHRAVDDARVDLNRIESREREYDARAHQQRQGDGHQPHRDGPQQAAVLPL